MIAKHLFPYHYEHRHSGIKFVTPHQRHTGQDEKVLESRTAVYEHAKQLKPKRWSGNTRDWSRVSQVWLNPDDEMVVLDKTI